jgi:V/A-type H+-transporting ATPase subunit B
VFSGSFRPLDDLAMFVPQRWAAVAGLPMNPVARARPQEMIETGFSTIDGLNTLVKGQKLPIFSCAGLPSREVAAGILEHARSVAAATGAAATSVVVFVGRGLGPPP